MLKVGPKCFFALTPSVKSGSNQVIKTSPPTTLHKLQMRELALEILDEVQESNPVNWKEEEERVTAVVSLRKCTATP
jgi:hypothetical protein